MFPFWYAAVAPVLTAVRPSRVVEIGAHQGEHTERLLDHLPPGSELHVIDPAPMFDPDEHARHFAGTYVFHRAKSLDVLGSLDRLDVALIDGDHNWYTVRHELELIDEAARASSTSLPVLILHDIGWPYGRRDVYYAPDDVPDEFRHPHRPQGLAPGRSDLLPSGGWNEGFEHATIEGGPRNGVLTALEDYANESERDLRLVVLLTPPGLAIAVDRDGWGAHPPLAEVLDRLDAQAEANELDSVELSRAYPELG